MSGFSTARQNMVDCQVRPSDVTDSRIIDAMLALPREAFVPPTQRKLAYLDLDLDVSDGGPARRYLIKPVREALILTESSAEVRSYALAVQALVLMAIVPAYTSLFRRILPHYQLVPWITGLLAANLLVFIVCGKAGYEIGIAYFIWIGIFNVLIVAQFWAFAADLFNVEAGERLFVLIMAGASIGSWARGGSASSIAAITSGSTSRSRSSA